MATISKRTLDNGQTRYVVDYYDLQGKRRKERYKRERDAKARLGEVLSQSESGELRPRADDIRFKQLVSDWRLAHWPELRPNSQAIYSRLLDLYLLPMLGERKLRTITLRDAEQLQQGVEQRVSQGAHADRSKGGRVSGNLALMLLRLLLSYAEKHSLVMRNVARHAKRRAATQQEERDVLTPSELRRLFDAADGMWRVFLMTAGLTGLRRGELLGLRWSNIEFSTGTVHVRQQLQRAQLVDLKSGAGRRSIAMPPELVHELKKWKLACPKGQKELVFCNRQGSPLYVSSVYEQGLQPALRRAGLREITLHGLRHGFGSMLISAGVSIKTVQVAMGHANVSLTLQVYTHMMPGDGAAVARTMSTSVFGPQATGNFLGTSSQKPQETGAAAGVST